MSEPGKAEAAGSVQAGWKICLPYFVEGYTGVAKPWLANHMGLFDRI